MDKYKIIIYGLIGIQAVWLVIILYYRSKLHNKLDRVNEILVKVSEGDLTQKIRDEDLNSDKIYLNLNNLILKFRNLVAQITTISDKTVNYTRELNQDTEKVSESTRETVKVVNEIAKSMESQMISMQKADEYSNDAMDTSRNIVAQSEEVGEKVGKTIETIEESSRNFEDLIEKLDMAAKSNEETARRVKKLENQTVLIDNISDRVNEITENINLLALNANIEAARAGEAGRGFAVVAEEVRKLAEDSARQSAQIQEVVDGIKGEIYIISDAMEKETESIKEYIEFSYKTREYLEQINHETKEISQVFNRINEDVIEQESQISKTVDIVRDTSYTFENIAASTEEMAASSENQSEVADETFKRLENLLEMNREIEEYIRSFAKNYIVDGETQSYINNGLKELREMSKESILKEMDFNSGTKYLKDKIAKLPQFELLALIDSNGVRKANTLDHMGQENNSFAHRPYFRVAIEGKDYISEPYISADTNNYCIAMSVPIKNFGEEIIGVIMGDLTL